MSLPPAKGAEVPMKCKTIAFSSNYVELKKNSGALADWLSLPVNQNCYPSIFIQESSWLQFDTLFLLNHCPLQLKDF